MPQEKPAVIVQTSYLLDLFCFIDLLHTDTISQYDEQIKYWEDYLSDESKKNLLKARKMLPKNETFVSMVVPLVSIDPELNILKTNEILSSPKYLITNYKKSDVYKLCKDKLFKQFMSGDCEKVIKLLTPIFMELEKAKFKNYWIHDRLPIINNQIKVLNDYLKTHPILDMTNHMLGQNLTNNKVIYVLSFYNTNDDSLVLPDLSLITHSNSEISKLIKDTIATIITLPIQSLNLKKEWAKLKRHKCIQNDYQQVKVEYRKISDYCLENLLLATHMYLNVALQVENAPYETLARYNFGTYKLSVIFYHYLETHPKEKTVGYIYYVKEMLENINLENIDQEVLSIMTIHK